MFFAKGSLTYIAAESQSRPAYEHSARHDDRHLRIMCFKKAPRPRVAKGHVMFLVLEPPVFIRGAASHAALPLSLNHMFFCFYDYPDDQIPVRFDTRLFNPEHLNFPKPLEILCASCLEEILLHLELNERTSDSLCVSCQTKASPAPLLQPKTQCIAAQTSHKHFSKPYKFICFCDDDDYSPPKRNFKTVLLKPDTLNQRNTANPYIILAIRSMRFMKIAFSLSGRQPPRLSQIVPDSGIVTACRPERWKNTQTNRHNKLQ